MRKRPERTVNLVRDVNDETYKVVSGVDLIMMRRDFDIIPEKQREQNGLYGYFYIRSPK